MSVSLPERFAMLDDRLTCGRKFKFGSFEPQFNRALFEVQAYYFSSPRVRAAATAKKAILLAKAKDLFADAEFMSSIESTTKSVENYRVRFTKYQRMLERAL
jgi:hypothetical protein